MPENDERAAEIIGNLYFSESKASEELRKTAYRLLCSDVPSLSQARRWRCTEIAKQVRDNTLTCESLVARHTSAVS
jgi:hypothetical protein